MKWIAVFSGQGGQRIEHVRQLRTLVKPPLGDAWHEALGGIHVDDQSLTRNRVAQPTLAAWQVTMFAALAAELPPPILVAGYSVGEIAAACAAGGYDATTAISLAAVRAQSMDEAMPRPGLLAGILGLTESVLDKVCARCSTAIAICNGPRHFVVGGLTAAVHATIVSALSEGATRAHPLRVTTPAHTHYLATAVPAFAAALQSRVCGPLRIPLASAIDATRVWTAQETVAALSRQLAMRLDWSACMAAIGEAQPDAVVEIGPGDALARMLTEAAPNVRARSVDEFRDRAAVTSWIRRSHT